jgi:hypothetical protein
MEQRHAPAAPPPALPACYRTPGFWVALSAQVLTIFALVGVVDMAQLASLQVVVGKVIVAVVALIVNLAPLIHYLRHNAELQALHLKITHRWRDEHAAILKLFKDPERPA